ncbi:site-specific integrase [Vibrio cyclitrophicus]|uniref:hypothetical protein n=1 Tax=Vibrio cyclitrophicus TaxID=47951 RepID=UPI0011B82485|nr:hypothetical protein [Vibrio cyclitrophicus]
MIRFKKTYFLRYVTTDEFGDRQFPLVFTLDGKVNYALLLFIKNEYALGGGKASNLQPVIDVVSDMLAFFECQHEKQESWLRNPNELLYAYFEAKLNGTVDSNGHCKLDLYWQKSQLSTVKRLISAYIKFEKFSKTYLGAPLTGIDQILIENARKTRRVEPDHRGLLSHLEGTYSQSGGNDEFTGGRLHFTSENYDVRAAKSSQNITKYFPPNDLAQFIKSEQYINYQAAYILQAFTALRGSEAANILIYDVVPSEDGLADIIVSDNQVKGKTLDPDSGRLIERDAIIKRNVTTITDKSGLTERDIEFLSNPTARTMIADKDDKYFAGDKSMTLQVSHPEYGYVLSWSNEIARTYFSVVLLPKLLKQNRVAGHPWLLCLDNGCPMTLGAYRKHLERRTLNELGFVRQPHTLRHFCGFYLMNALDWKLENIKVFMRHAYLSSTERYAQPTAAKVRALIAKKEYTEFSNLNFREFFE